ncbi:MAG TPA: FG-GAP-like repeat-containing protein [Bacteroidota bacterium]|nr:FG-GAP-like repeat-containing protein [Bacteroidota bacterium]
MAFNVEAFDINKDGKKDIVVGNWNDTYVYFGGKGILDSTPNVIYKGRLLAICDYNGDGIKDMITMHFTNYDSTRHDYDGEILFYWGSDTTTLAIDTIPDYSIPLPTQYPVRDGFSVGEPKPGVQYGDFNGDGKADLVINSLDAAPGVGVVSIYMGSTVPSDTPTYVVRGRSYVPGKPPIVTYGTFFEVGDINADGYDDLLLSYLVQGVPPNGQDSLDVIDLYLGGKNFSFTEDGESMRYESRVNPMKPNTSYGWVKKEFSLGDVNGDGIPDLIIDQYYKDSTEHVHFGSVNGIDTIPSFYLAAPDTTRSDVYVGGTCFNIGDFNNDGYNDLILAGSYFNSFSLHLGGPHLSNRNPYGLRGLLGPAYFPTKAISCGDQNGDGVDDFIALGSAISPQDVGYALIFLGDPTIVADVNSKVFGGPETFQLFQNYPNPFNPSTKISYQLSANNFVTLKIYDLLGREVATLENGNQEQGRYAAVFDASRLSSGIYFYELRAGNYRSVKKMVLMK